MRPDQSDAAGSPGPQKVLVIEACCIQGISADVVLGADSCLQIVMIGRKEAVSPPLSHRQTLLHASGQLALFDALSVSRPLSTERRGGHRAQRHGERQQRRGGVRLCCLVAQRHRDESEAARSYGIRTGNQAGSGPISEHLVRPGKTQDSVAAGLVTRISCDNPLWWKLPCEQSDLAKLSSGP